MVRVLHKKQNLFVVEKNKIENPFPHDNNAVCCNKDHVTKALKEAEKKKQKDVDTTNINIPWGEDGKNGRNDPNNSLAILLDWLTTIGNYARYKGDASNGVTKLVIAGQIARLINSRGVRKERTNKQVINKIDHLVRQYKDASDWANQTGAGVLETQGKETFDQAVSSCACDFCSKKFH